MSKYVDVELLEKEIREYADKKHFNGEIELANGILKSLAILNQAPRFALNEVTRGEWVLRNDECDFVAGITEYVCTNCNDFIVEEHQKTKYCPNCGSIMKG